MRNTFIKEFKELVVDKKIWIGILTVLIILIIGTSYNAGKAEDIVAGKIYMGVINRDESPYSELLLSYFSGSEALDGLIAVRKGEDKEIKEAFGRGELDLYLEIPENFASDMMSIENVPIKVTIDSSDTTKALLFKNLLHGYEKYITSVEANAVGLYEIMEQEGQDQELIEEANRKISMDLIFTALGRNMFFSYQPVEQFPQVDPLIYYSGSVLIMLLLYLGLNTGFLVLKEMNQGTLTRLRTTRTPICQLFAAKATVHSILLTLLLAAAIRILMTSDSGSFKLFHKPWDMRIFIYCLSVAMFCICLGIFLSSLFRTTQSFALTGNLMIFLFAIMGGGIIPVTYLPYHMVLLSKLTPFYHMLKGLLEIEQELSGNVGRVSVCFLLVSLVLFGLAVIIFGRRSVKGDEE